MCYYSLKLMSDLGWSSTSSSEGGNFIRVGKLSFA